MKLWVKSCDCTKIELRKYMCWNKVEGSIIFENWIVTNVLGSRQKSTDKVCFEISISSNKVILARFGLQTLKTDSKQFEMSL